jgi:hypothetical protein
MVECPAWKDPEGTQQLPSVVEGMADFHRFIVKKAAKHILTHRDLKTWHTRIFSRVVPLSYYAGNYRSIEEGLPCLSQDVEVGGISGARFQDVPQLMNELSDEVRAWIISTDKYVSSNPTPENRTKAVLQLAALYAGKFVRIHPFINGNGRMSRLIANYVLTRYQYPPPYYDPYPRPGGDYASAGAACMIGNLVPLYQYLLSCLAGRLT